MYPLVVPTYKYVKRSGHPLTEGIQKRLPEHRVVLYDKIGAGPHPCHWCGTEVQWMPGNGPRKGSLVTDHLDNDPRNNTPENLVPSCQPCNGTRRWTGHLDGQLVIFDSQGKRNLAVERVCQNPPCGKAFLVAKKFLRSEKHGRFCSRRCHYDSR